jgi:pimeloyl-ACP methyl ester carboxylesterase
MRFHCTALAAVLVLVMAAPARAQRTDPAPGDAVFAIFLRGTQIGREQWTLAKIDSGWVISSSGRTAPPLDFTVNRFEVKYAPDWQPLEMALEARLRNQSVIVRTSFAMTRAINEITQNNVTGSKEDEVSVRTIVIPNNVFAGYEALGVRLWSAQVNSELPVYVVPAGEMKIKVNEITAETLKGPAGSVATRRFDITLENADHPTKAFAVVDERLRLVRFEIPEIGLQAVREDVSSVAVRTQVTHNPTDSDVSFHANGFEIAATLTTPPEVAGRLRSPAVLLVGGTSPADRDETIGGVPVFAELARALADTGHIVLRYDRRGTGQSGGRTDTATLSDYADDAAAGIRWLAKRDDVDKRRIVIVGHMDGGPVALIAAGAEKQIDAVVTIDAAGKSGADLIMMQQEKVLDDLKLADADRQARIDLQKKIQTAVVTGGGWDGVPEAMRRQADTPWFKSVLTYEPAAVLEKTRQPILVLHCDLDPNIPASEADSLGALAKARKKAGPTEVVHIPDAGRALTPAGSSQLNAKVTSAIADWIKKL